MTEKEKGLVWALAQQAIVLRRVEAAMKLLQPVEGDISMHEARYQRAIKDAGLEAEAKAAEEYLHEAD
jgi:hypothetical protein